MAFVQESFTYKDLFAESTFLSDLSRHFLPQHGKGEVSEDLKRFSKLCATDILNLSWQAEDQPPVHRPFDPWGRRVDVLETSPAWDCLHRIAAKEGLVAIGYERKQGEESRCYQMLKLMLFHPSSAFYSCPLAMTDGAASVLEPLSKEPFATAFSHLVSRDPQSFWTAGQWMTEQIGGSDVSKSQTVATAEGDTYRLSGSKWFTSAITAQVSMTLAQIEQDGKNKLSLFFVPIRNSHGQLNHIEVRRLKDKLGTRAMPTAELDLQSTPGYLIGEPGQGVKNIAQVLNITRLYNSACAAGTLLRLLSLAKDYAQKRQAFGKSLWEHPLHLRSLFRAQVINQACHLFVLEVARCLGRQECGQASDGEQALLRVMTPVLKMWTAKQSFHQVSELVESFGGAGYIEDTGLPKFLRDAQVFSIWEGTTNIMSLDTLRALSQANHKENLFDNFSERIEKLRTGSRPMAEELEKALVEVRALVASDPKHLAWEARELANQLADLMVGILLLEFYKSTGLERDRLIAESFISLGVKAKEFRDIHSLQSALLA